jgi:hypothetical protein
MMIGRRFAEQTSRMHDESLMCTFVHGKWLTADYFLRICSTVSIRSSGCRVGKPELDRAIGRPGSLWSPKRPTAWWASLDFIATSLWVLDTNTRAIGFYQALGWRSDGAVKHDIMGGAPRRDLRYRCALA